MDCTHEIAVEWYPPKGDEKFFVVVKCTKCKQIIGVLPNNARLSIDIMASISKTTLAVNTHLAKIEEYLKTIAEKK